MSFRPTSRVSKILKTTTQAVEYKLEPLLSWVNEQKESRSTLVYAVCVCRYIYIYIYTYTHTHEPCTWVKWITKKNLLTHKNNNKILDNKKQRKKIRKQIIIIINIGDTPIKDCSSNGFLQELYSTERNIVWRFPG